MKLRAGLLHDSSGWVQLFRQEGFPLGIVDARHFDPDQWSVVVINRPPDERESLVLDSYLRSGGSILSCNGYGQRVLGIDSYDAKIEYVTPLRGETFEDLGILDVGADCLISREANLLLTEGGNNAVFAGEWKGGNVVDLPFDPAELMFDGRSTMRLFHAAVDRLPSETVSFVSKGVLRLLIHRALEFLHHSRGMPYAHLWYFPGRAANCFSFRIDTDGAPQRDIEDLYALSVRHEVPFSWYLDVKSHQEWLGVFRSMKGQELGVHCYEHRTFASREENAANISLALKLMGEEGMSPGGFAAPYGAWNPNLARAIDDSGFLYSSEFSYAYDTFPHYPEAGGIRFSSLQVPIHPICIGSMRKVGYTSEQMCDYFLRSVEAKLCRNEPLFYYHHPAHGHPEVVEVLINAVRSRGIAPTTLGEFARWWKLRESVEVDLDSSGATTRFQAGTNTTPDPTVWLEFTTGGGMSRKVPLSAGVVNLDEEEWKRVCRMVPPDDIRRIREFDPRARFADWFNTFLRKIQ